MGRRLLRVIVGALFLFDPAGLSAAELEVTVEGLRNARGTVRLVLHHDPAAFPSGEPTAHINLPARKGRVLGRVRGLKSGLHALALLHDENDSGGMDSNVVGLPQEGYGFSNDAKVFLGPPSFAAASFKVDPGLTAITVTVVY